MHVDSWTLAGALGLPGTGKTVLIQRLAIELANAGWKVRIVDTWESFASPYSFNSVSDYRKFVYQSRSDPRYVVFRALPGTERAKQLLLEVADLVSLEGGVLILDEVSELVDPQKPLNPALARIGLRGRKTPRAKMVWGAQRATLVHPTLRPMTQYLFVLRQNSALDLKWLRDNTYPYSALIANIAPTLANLQFVKIPLTGGPQVPLRIETIDLKPLDVALRGRG